MIKRRTLSALLVLALAFAVLPAVASERVGVVRAADGATLWFPASAPNKGVRKALAVRRSFIKTWKAYFGNPPLLPDPLAVPAGRDLSESLFYAMWSASAKTLAPDNRAAALASLRGAVLGDPAPLMAALAGAADGRILDAAMLNSPLTYAFLMEEVGDPSFLPKALPPGPGGDRLRSAVHGSGLSWDAYANRFAAWIFRKMIEARILTAPPGSLPAVWVINHDIPAGGFEVWSFPLSKEEEGVDLRSASSCPNGFRLISLYTDHLGRVVREGVGSLSESLMRMPKAGSTLWVVLWNGGSEAGGTGLTFTLWKDLEPPFIINSAKRAGKKLDLLLREGPGILDYFLWERGASGGPLHTMALPSFSSRGEGLHLYRLLLPGSVKNGIPLSLSCRMNSGGSFAAPIPRGGEAAP